MKSGHDIENGEGLPVDQGISGATPRPRFLAFFTASIEKRVDPGTSFRPLGYSGCRHEFDFGQRLVCLGRGAEK